MTIENPTENLVDNMLINGKNAILESIEKNDPFVVSIDVWPGDKTAKYVVVKGDNNRIYVIAKPLNYHSKILSWLVSFSPDKNLNFLGGGYITKEDENKTIKIYGKSSHGEDDKKQTCEILKSAFMDFSVSADEEQKEEISPCQILAFKLDMLQKDENEGRGVGCVQTVVHYLSVDQIDQAKAVCFNESDKISNYPKIKKFIISELFQKNNHPWSAVEKFSKK